MASNTYFPSADVATMDGEGQKGALRDRPVSDGQDSPDQQARLEHHHEAVSLSAEYCFNPDKAKLQLV